MTEEGRRGLPTGLAFVGPFLVLYAFLLVYPLIDGLVLSFHRADPFGIRVFAGLE